MNDLDAIALDAEAGMWWTMAAAWVAATLAFTGNKALGKDKSNVMSLLWGAGAMTGTYLVGYSVVAARAGRQIAAAGLPAVEGTETGRLSVQLFR